MKQRKNKTSLSFNIEFEREEDGRWIAEIPKLPGVMVYGDTKQTALRNVYVVALRTLADKTEQGRIPASVSKLFSHAVARR